MKKIIIIFSIATLLYGCSKHSEALACFQLSKTTFDVDELISFKNCSISNFRNTWSFGDGNSSQDSFPTHKFSQEGNYVVTLRSTAEDGSTTNSISQMIKIENGYTKFYPYLTGDFTATFKNGIPVTSNQNLTFSTNALYPNRLYFNTPSVNFAKKKIIGMINLNEVTFAEVEDEFLNNSMGPNATATFKDASWKLDTVNKVLNIAYSIEVKNAATLSNNGTTRYVFKSDVK